MSHTYRFARSARHAVVLSLGGIVLFSFTVLARAYLTSAAAAFLMTLAVLLLGAGTLYAGAAIVYARKARSDDRPGEMPGTPPRGDHGAS
jgi:hypothetical protein